MNSLDNNAVVISSLEKEPSHFLFNSHILSQVIGKDSSRKALYLFRVCACVWSLVTILLYQLVFIQQPHLEFLTNVTFVLFCAYFTFQT